MRGGNQRGGGCVCEEKFGIIVEEEQLINYYGGLECWDDLDLGLQ